MLLHTCQCGAKYRLRDAAAGKKANCKKCGSVFTVCADAPVAITTGPQDDFITEITSAAERSRSQPKSQTKTMCGKDDPPESPSHSPSQKSLSKFDLLPNPVRDMLTCVVVSVTRFRGRNRPWYLTALAALYFASTIVNCIGTITLFGSILHNFIGGIRAPGFDYSDLPVANSWSVGAMVLTAYLTWGLWTGSRGAQRYLVLWGALLAIFPWIFVPLRAIFRGEPIDYFWYCVVSCLCTGWGMALILAVRTRAASRFFVCRSMQSHRAQHRRVHGCRGAPSVTISLHLAGFATIQQYPARPPSSPPSGSCGRFCWFAAKR